MYLFILITPYLGTGTYIIFSITLRKKAGSKIWDNLKSLKPKCFFNCIISSLESRKRWHKLLPLTDLSVPCYPGCHLPFLPLQNLTNYMSTWDMACIFVLMSFALQQIMTYNAPFFTTWFCTNWTIFFFPIFLLVQLLKNGCKFPSEAIQESVKSFRDKGLTAGTCWQLIYSTFIANLFSPVSFQFFTRRLINAVPRQLKFQIIKKSCKQKYWRDQRCRCCAQKCDEQL